jgi:hypothetical protein
VDDLDAELRRLAPFPPDMQEAVTEYLRQSSLHGFIVLGLAVKEEPFNMTVIGNVYQRQLDIVALFRLYADVMEKRLKEHGVIEIDVTPNPDAV